jgi:hypothetical protein
MVAAIVGYATADYSIRRDARFGRLRVLQIARRYFLNVFNSVDKTHTKVAAGPLPKAMYLAELEALLQHLEDLGGNPYYAGLIEQYPLMAKALLQIRREIVEHRASKGDLSLNAGTMADFWTLHQLALHGSSSRIRRVLGRDSIPESELDRAIAQFAQTQALPDPGR